MEKFKKLDKALLAINWLDKVYKDEEWHERILRMKEVLPEAWLGMTESEQDAAYDRLLSFVAKIIDQLRETHQVIPRLSEPDLGKLN